MKKLNLLSAFMLLFMAIGFTSCDSEPVDPLLIGNEEEPTGPAIFKVDFSGATYTADQAQAVVTGSSIMISGIKTSNGSVFALSVPATTTGTYDGGDGVMMSYKPTLASTFMYMNVDPTLELEDPTGTITITSINTTAKTISGTFNFTGYWSDETANQPNIAFTNGSFQNIPYTGNVGPQPTSLFKVNIDGTLYTADESLATIGEGLISVAGMRGNNGEMVAIIVNATTTGTYTDAAIMAYYESDEDENGYNNFLENPGTVTISNIDTVNNTISGTFSFTGVNDAGQEKVFTNGVFENVPYTTENTSDDVLKATVDGTFIDYANSVAVTFVGVGNDGNIGIVGIGADGAGIRLSISNALAEGIYPISNATDATVRGYFSVSEDNEFAASTGSLTITSKANGRIAGTFQYTVTDGSSTVHQVTTGQFDVEYDW